MGNLLKIERRQIEGKCGRTIATEPRASDGPCRRRYIHPFPLWRFWCAVEPHGSRSSPLLGIEVGTSRLGKTAFPPLTETQDGQ